MSQNTHQDLEEGNDPDRHHDHPHSTQNQPSLGDSNYDDSSGQFFSIYSKAAEEEDNKMVERWQEDAQGILIFTGLFSAAVAALLSVTVQDLRPNSQDTSAFYLGNIYGVLADPNVTRVSVPSPVAKPPPFSPPRYSVWVNSLWFLSLVMSLSCALWATSLHQWARRYIRLTQPARCSPEKRARMRAFFANGVDKMRIPWAVEGLPTLLHLSLFLFFGGLVIFLFSVDREVFTCVVWWIGLFSIVYGLITLLPLIRQDSPYYTPLSISTWVLYAGIQYMTLTILAFISDIRGCNEAAYLWYRLRHRYRDWMLVGVENIVSKTASKPSLEVDVRIFGWTISALGNDNSLEKFFEAIPGLFNSKLVMHFERDFPERLLFTFWGALDGFLGRTLSSNSVTESVKSRRVLICRNIISMIPCPYDYMPDNLYPHLYQAPVSIERLQAMSRWFTHLSPDVSDAARTRVAKNLPRMQERDNRWIGLASDACGLASDDIQHNIAMGGDNMLLATLIDVSRQAIRSNMLEMLELVEALTQFDIRRTHLRLQHDFCMLWNELVQEARNREPYVILTDIAHIDVLRLIRLLYVALHQGTRAAPTAFSPSTDLSDPILFEPSSYPLCDISNHRQDWIAHPHVPVPNSRAVSLLTQSTDSPDALPRHSTSRGNTVSQQVKQANVIAGPPAPSDPTISSEIGDSSQVPKATSLASLVHTSSRPTDTSPPRAQDIPPAATLSRALQNIVVPCAERDTREILSTASTTAHTPTPSPVPEFIPPVLNESSTSCDADAASASNPLLPASSVVGFSVPASPPPSRVSPFPNTESLALFDGTTPFPLTRNAALLHLRARGLVNTGSMCSVNAVLQLLVHSPPLWNLFRRWGDLKGQSGTGGPESGGATSLMDATVIFFEEFMNKEKGPFPTQQTSGGKPRECEEAKKEPNGVDSFEPTYIYNAMKEKRQLKSLLDGQQQDAEEFFRLYLDALDEELLALQEREVSRSGQTEVVKRGLTPVESPLMRIFGGKFRSTVTVHAPNQPDTVNIEDWRSLQLDIQHDSVHAIEDALARISHLRPVQLDPSGFSEACQQVKIEVLPPILVLHLKRFLYDVAADGIVKINKHVQFAPEVEIPLEIMAPDAEKPAELVHYKLYGVLYHHGESADSGHYSVDVLHQNGCSGSGEAWLHIDDEVVRALRHEDVFLDVFGSHNNEHVDARCAYMLFYFRIQ